VALPGARQRLRASGLRRSVLLSYGERSPRRTVLGFVWRWGRPRFERLGAMRLG